MQEYFMKTSRIGFATWDAADMGLAEQLWGDPDVTRFICASGRFTEQEIRDRLAAEIQNHELFHIQYWPVFELTADELVGCCGLRPFPSELRSYELGFHLRKKFWGQGYAQEAAKAVIEHGFKNLGADKLYAGHHPQNRASEKLLIKLGFQNIGRSFYEPTGLCHPSYRLEKHG